MKLEKLPTSTGPAGKATEGDLLASMSALLDRLEKARGKPDLDFTDTMDTAVSTVMKAEKRIVEQSKRIAYLERLAITDELTSLLNRRGFINQLHHSLATARRYEERGVLIYVDLDNFKPINDTYGHAAGDRVLTHVAKMLMANVRDTDYVGRMGGDEFAILLTRSTLRDGLKRAEALDQTLNTSAAHWRGRQIPFRASLGFLAYGPEDNGKDLLARVDNAMYKTKRLRARPLEERASA